MAAPGRLRKLHWLCRRGMKELDVLLEGFLARHRSELEQGGFSELEFLLQSEDDLLWQWVQGTASEVPERYSELLRLIRSGA